MDRFFVVQFLFFAVWTAALLYYPPLSGGSLVPVPSTSVAPPRAAGSLRPPVPPRPGFAQAVPPPPAAVAVPAPPAQPAAGGKQGANGEWVDDVAYAKQVASSTSRPILTLFTGSDWCGWCKRLDGEVFSKPEFKQFASQKVVMLKIDFPRGIPQTDAVRQANRALQTQYGVRGYPTVVLTDATGRELGRTGYKPGGPPAFIAELERSLPH